MTNHIDPTSSSTVTRLPRTSKVTCSGVWPSKGFVTLKQILGKYGGPIPCGRTTWWARVKTGEFPKPLKVAGRTVWRVSDIDALITRLEQQDAK